MNVLMLGLVAGLLSTGGEASLCGSGDPSTLVGIAAEDSDALAEFYVGRLGFRRMLVIPIEDRPSIQILACGTQVIEIVPAAGPHPARPEGGGLNAGPFKFGLEAASFEGAQKMLAGNGVEIAFGPVTDDNGIRFLILRDPEGNAVQIFENLTPQASSTEADRAAIIAQSKAFSAAYAAEDVETMLQIYEPDGVAAPGGRDFVVGTDALRTIWTVPEGVDVIRHSATPVSLMIDGRYAYDQGYYEGANIRDGNEQAFSGKYLIVWHKGDDGIWRMAQDMWNRKD